MNVVHLYLQPRAAGALGVVKHTFTGSAAPTMERSCVSADDRNAWLESLANDSAVTAIYNCAGTRAEKPQGLKCSWIDLSEGHPCERM